MIKIWRDKEYGYYQIQEVTFMLEQLRGNGILFTSNEYNFFSRTEPAIHGYTSHIEIFLMGTNKRKDNKVVKFPLHRFDGIVLAFKEFEEHFKTLTM